MQGQTSHFDAIEVTVENLEPDEIEQWSKLGFGDEIILNRYRDGVGLQRCMIRGIDWDINIGNGHQHHRVGDAAHQPASGGPLGRGHDLARRGVLLRLRLRPA